MGLGQEHNQGEGGAGMSAKKKIIDDTTIPDCDACGAKNATRHHVWDAETAKYLRMCTPCAEKRERKKKV